MFILSQCERTASPLESLLSNDYLVSYLDFSTIYVADGYGKCGVGPRTTHHTS